MHKQRGNGGKYVPQHASDHYLPQSAFREQHVTLYSSYEIEKKNNAKNCTKEKAK